MSNATQDALKRPTINGFHHVAILACNLECAVEFYGVTLGLSALPLPPDLEGERIDGGGGVLMPGLADMHVH